jgi:hypothetical protein
MVFYRRAHGEPSTYDGIEIWQHEFDDFMVSSECISIMATSLPDAGNESAVQADFAIFQNGLKRDHNLYPVIVHDDQWDTWHNRSWIRRTFQFCPTRVHHLRRNRCICILFFNGQCKPTKEKPSYGRTKPRTMRKRSTRNCMTIVVRVLGQFLTQVPCSRTLRLPCG